MTRRIVSLAAAVLVGTGAVVASTPAVAHATGEPQVTVGDVAVAEGDAGRSVVKVPVDLSVPSTTGTVYVPYTVRPVADGVTDSTDAVVKTGKLAFPVGVASKPVTVAVNGDTTPELDQHFAVKLGTPTGATVADGTGVVNIRDDDANGVDPGVTVSVGDVTVHEADAGTHLAYLPVTLSRPAPAPMTVSFVTGCASLVRITDLTVATSGTIKFLAGQQSKTITLRVSANVTAQDLGDVLESIKASVGPVAVADSTGTAQVIDNDGGSVGTGLGVGSREQVSMGPNCTRPTYPTTGGSSRQAATSADGRYVVFYSDATNLVPDDTNGIGDVFVRDRVTDTTERVNLKPDGSQMTLADMHGLEAFGPSMWAPSISADGRYVAFTTVADLVPGDVGPHPNWIGYEDAYVVDRQTHTISLVSANPDGSETGGVFSGPSISADGNLVTYTVMGDSMTSWSTLSTPGPEQYAFVRNRAAGTTTLLTDQPAQGLVMSADGSTAVVSEYTHDPHHPALEAIDLATGSTDRVDVTDDGTPAAESDFSDQNFRPSVSADGRYVAFKSFAWNLIPGQAGPLTSYSGAFPADLTRIYVRDRLLGTTTIVGDPTLVQSWLDPVSISDDGQLVAIGAWSGQTGTLFDRAAGTQQTFGVPLANVDGTVLTTRAMSGDGRFVTFTATTGTTSEAYVQRVR